MGKRREEVGVQGLLKTQRQRHEEEEMIMHFQRRRDLVSRENGGLEYEKHNSISIIIMPSCKGKFCNLDVREDVQKDIQKFGMTSGLKAEKPFSGQCSNLVSLETRSNIKYLSKCLKFVLSLNPK